MDIQRFNVKKLLVRCFKIKSSKTLFPSSDIVRLVVISEMLDERVVYFVAKKFFETFELVFHLLQNVIVHNLGYETLQFTN